MRSRLFDDGPAIAESSTGLEFFRRRRGGRHRLVRPVHDIFMIGLSRFGRRETRGRGRSLHRPSLWKPSGAREMREDRACVEALPNSLSSPWLRRCSALRGLQATRASTRRPVRSEAPPALREPRHPPLPARSSELSSRGADRQGGSSKKMNDPLPSRPGERALRLRGGARRFCRQGRWNRLSGRRIPSFFRSSQNRSHDLVVAARARPAYNIKVEAIA